MVAGIFPPRPRISSHSRPRAMQPSAAAQRKKVSPHGNDAAIATPETKWMETVPIP